MTKGEFREIAERIESAYRQQFTDLQFEEWWDSFGDEDYDIVIQAFELMKDKYAYFPVVATFRSFLEQAKEVKEAKLGREGKVEVKPLAPEDLDRHKRWMRFIQWIGETTHLPKTSKEVLEMKERFEKEHPDWQPAHKRPKSGPEQIGSIFARRGKGVR